ncbi:cilia- and flagella-associated protein 251-like [Notolabrus celidotus]|uniref:cilia- and flagella-associated protein 251-like n=1 Tax=Notolabrus celidotus TaxID=1203425 RepID=UPI00148FAB9C|nr:cilia- and flagella-associated protein 251-like [Notolabrus celidotus]
MTAGTQEENVSEREDEMEEENEEQQKDGGKEEKDVEEEKKHLIGVREEETEALVGRQEDAEEEEEELQLHQSESRNSSAPPCPLDSAETLRGDGAETGLEVQGDENNFSDAAKNHNGDIYPTSAGRDKEEEEGAETKTVSLTHIHVPSVHAGLNLRYLTDQEIQRLEERFGTLSVTSFPAPGDHIELAEEAVDEDTWEIIPDLHAELQDFSNSLGMSTEAGGPESNEPSPAQNSSSTENSAGEVKEENDEKVEGGKNSQQHSGADAADDKKNGSSQASKFKTVSYRRIRRGNTRQRIDEFEAMMDS